MQYPGYTSRWDGTLGLCKHLRGAVEMGLIDAPSWAPPAENPAPTPAEVEAPPAAFVEAVRDAIGPAEDLGPDSPVTLDAYLAATAAPAEAPEPPAAPAEDESDLLQSLPWPRPARQPFLTPSPAPLPRPLPASGAYTLAELADAQADSYAALGNAVGTLFARHMRALAAQIRATGARSVAEFDERLPLLEAERDDRLRDEGYAAGRAVGCDCGIRT